MNFRELSRAGNIVTIEILVPYTYAVAGEIEDHYGYENILGIKLNSNKTEMQLRLAK